MDSTIYASLCIKFQIITIQYTLQRLIPLHIKTAGIISTWQMGYHQMYTSFLLFLYNSPTQSSTLSMQANCSVSINGNHFRAWSWLPAPCSPWRGTWEICSIHWLAGKTQGNNLSSIHSVSITTALWKLCVRMEYAQSYFCDAVN